MEGMGNTKSAGQKADQEMGDAQVLTTQPVDGQRTGPFWTIGTSWGAPLFFSGSGPRFVGLFLVFLRFVYFLFTFFYGIRPTNRFHFSSGSSVW